MKKAKGAPQGAPKLMTVHHFRNEFGILTNVWVENIPEGLDRWDITDAFAGKTVAADILECIQRRPGWGPELNGFPGCWVYLDEA